MSNRDESTTPIVTISPGSTVDKVLGLFDCTDPNDCFEILFYTAGALIIFSVIMILVCIVLCCKIWSESEGSENTDSEYRPPQTTASPIGYQPTQQPTTSNYDDYNNDVHDDTHQQAPINGYYSELKSDEAFRRGNNKREWDARKKDTRDTHSDDVINEMSQRIRRSERTPRPFSHQPTRQYDNDHSPDSVIDQNKERPQNVRNGQSYENSEYNRRTSNHVIATNDPIGHQSRPQKKPSNQHYYEDRQERHRDKEHRHRGHDSDDRKRQTREDSVELGPLPSAMPKSTRQEKYPAMTYSQPPVYIIKPSK